MPGDERLTAHVSVGWVSLLWNGWDKISNFNFLFWNISNYLHLCAELSWGLCWSPDRKSCTHCIYSLEMIGYSMCIVCLHFVLDPLLRDKLGLLLDVHRRPDFKRVAGSRLSSPTQERIPEWVIGKGNPKSKMIYMQSESIHSRRSTGIIQIKLHSVRSFTWWVSIEDGVWGDVEILPTGGTLVLPISSTFLEILGVS